MEIRWRDAKAEERVQDLVALRRNEAELRGGLMQMQQDLNRALEDVGGLGRLSGDDAKISDVLLSVRSRIDALLSKANF